MTNKEHQPYLDYLRCIAIVAVIAIHSFYPFQITSNPGTYWSMLCLATLAQFAVPLYAMISGALLLSQPIISLKVFYRKRFLRLGVPLLVWTSFYGLLDVWGNPGIHLPTKLIQTFIFGQPLYFLFALAGLYAITPYLQKLLINLSRYQVLTLTGFCLSLTALTAGVEYWLLADNNVLGRFSFNYFLYYLGYYLLGYWLHASNVSVTKAKLLAVVVGSALVTTVVTHFLVGVYGPGYKAQVLFQQFSPSVILMSAAVFTLVKELVGSRNPSILSAKLARHLSSYSLGIYFVHLGVLGQLSLRLPELNSPLISSSLIFILTLIVSTLIVAVGKKIKGSWILGF